MEWYCCCCTFPLICLLPFLLYEVDDIVEFTYAFFVPYRLIAVANLVLGWVRRPNIMLKQSAAVQLNCSLGPGGLLHQTGIRLDEIIETDLKRHQDTFILLLHPFFHLGAEAASAQHARRGANAPAF